MKRKLVTLSLLLLAVAFWASSNAPNALRIHCKSGEDVTILLEENPVIRFQDSDVVISTDHNAVSLPSDEAERLTYVNVDPTGISSAVLPEALFTLGRESLTVANLDPQTLVAIYTVDGRLISSATTDLNGSAVLSLPAQSSSVYIVRTPSLSFKLIRP